MTDPHRLRCYEYVNQPYDQVQARLRADASGIFNRATMLSAQRASTIGAQLRMQVGALDVATEVQIEIGRVEDKVSSPHGHPLTEFPLSWRSKHYPGLFPHMHAKLLVYPLSANETQLELEGTYNPPLGLLGEAFDALVGHRVAEATVLRFIQDVAAGLRSEMEGAR